MKLKDLREELDDDAPKLNPHGSFYDLGKGDYRVAKLAETPQGDFLPPGLPRSILGNLWASSLGLMTLERAPRYITRANLNANHLKNLSGSLTECSTLDVSRNELTSLEGDVRKVVFLNASQNHLKSLKGIHKILDQCNELSVTQNPLESHVLGVLLVKGMNSVAFVLHDENPKLLAVERIVNKYLPNARGMEALLECQDELIEAGYGEFAQL